MLSVTSRCRTIANEFAMASAITSTSASGPANPETLDAELMRLAGSARLADARSGRSARCNRAAGTDLERDVMLERARTTGAVHSGRSVMLRSPLSRERVHLFFDDVGRFADAAHEEFGRLENRRAYLAVAVTFARASESAPRASFQRPVSGGTKSCVPRGAAIFDDMAPRGFKEGRGGPPQHEELRALLACVALAAVSLAPVLGAAPAPGVRPSPKTLDALLHGRIKRVFVIYQENRSFDSEFGTFPGANGVSGRRSRARTASRRSIRSRTAPLRRSGSPNPTCICTNRTIATSAASVRRLAHRSVRRRAG